MGSWTPFLDRDWRGVWCEATHLVHQSLHSFPPLLVSFHGSVFLWLFFTSFFFSFLLHLLSSSFPPPSPSPAMSKHCQQERASQWRNRGRTSTTWVRPPSASSVSKPRLTVLILTNLNKELHAVSRLGQECWGVRWQLLTLPPGGPPPRLTTEICTE